ncbi:ArsR family transcriptional regulator [Methanobrevibacter sp. TMH8]|uniref:ArsR family transcriptional regulator n=1 Tax=Methanobrevibacter sp. TMH8 TaxID=2848611 RepID=UPI001CCC0FD2|nr:ArsR family transcriptional regulator [Methanobrevibacter sp. TMH8]MBZ9570949.1 ArsR family transcriptional regulator [Methanobrevibacter sp. TMH8]
MKQKQTSKKDFQKINNENNDYNKDTISEIKNMVKDIQNDIKKMTENSNEEHLSFMYTNLKNEFINSMNGYMIDKIDPELEQRMVNPCDMRNQCKNIFKKYLKKHTDDLNPDNISNEKISKSYDEFEKIKENKQKDECDQCFDEVSNIFENHVALIKSVKIYDNQKDEDEKKISDIDEKYLVQNVLNSISHEKRLKILKSIAIEPQSFSALSNLTDLRGGNLIFHINKLLKSDLIFQKQNHKEYMLTTKGFKIIQLLLNIES